jgi:hypothetical protein
MVPAEEGPEEEGPEEEEETKHYELRKPGDPG